MSEPAHIHSVLTWGRLARSNPSGVWWLFRKIPVPTWASIGKIGQLSIVRTLWIWAVIVPIAARILTSMPEEIPLPLFDRAIPLHLRLPFSWQIFYFASLTMAIGTIIYNWRCPKIVRGNSPVSYTHLTLPTILLV